jgi:hypothetical protein
MKAISARELEHAKRVISRDFSLISRGYAELASGNDGKTCHPPFKCQWNDIEGKPGIYLTLNGSASVWAGFKSLKEALTCLKVLPGWKLCIRK